MAAVSLDPSRYQCEVLVRPDLDQRIDVLDRTEMCAFEFKVSGKNATAEFYKDIVKVTVFVTDVRYREAYGEVRSEFFGPNPPASTLVQISNLAIPDALIEIEAIAAMD